MEESTTPHEIISLESGYEVRHWMRTVNCTQMELYAAVAAVGKNLSDVVAYREKLTTGRIADA